MHCSVALPRCAIPPRLRQFVCDPRHGLGVCASRTKVPTTGEAGSVLSESLGEHQISAQRLNDELPGADGGRVTYWAGVALEKRPHEVGNELIAGPITTADSVPGASSGNSDAVLVKQRGREKGVSIGGGHKLGTALRIRIGVSTTHGLVLAISPDPLAVRVALVTCDIDDYTGLSELP